MSKQTMEIERVRTISNFIEDLRADVDELFDLMVDGTDQQEKEHINKMILKLKELNTDR